MPVAVDAELGERVTGTARVLNAKGGSHLCVQNHSLRYTIAAREGQAIVTVPATTAGLR